MSKLNSKRKGIVKQITYPVFTVSVIFIVIAVITFIIFNLSVLLNQRFEYTTQIADEVVTTIEEYKSLDFLVPYWHDHYEEMEFFYGNRNILEQKEKQLSALIQDYSDDSKLTFGERMAVAGGNTIIGLLTVFTVLILLSLIIYCFKFVNAAVTPPAPKKEASVSVPDKAAKSGPAKAVPAAKKEEDPMLDPALVAVIAAAIAAAEEKPVEGFVVRSIKRVKTNKWR